MDAVDGPFCGGLFGAWGAVVPPSSSGGRSSWGEDVLVSGAMGNVHRFEADVASLMVCSATAVMGAGISGFWGIGEEVSSGG